LSNFSTFAELFPRRSASAPIPLDGATLKDVQSAQDRKGCAAGKWNCSAAKHGYIAARQPLWNRFGKTSRVNRRI
jgi:hypothetical protein